MRDGAEIENIKGECDGQWSREEECEFHQQ